MEEPVSILASESPAKMSQDKVGNTAAMPSPATSVSPVPASSGTPPAAKMVSEELDRGMSHPAPQQAHAHPHPHQLQRNVPRVNARRAPNKKKANQQDNHEPSWRAAAWIGSPIVAPGPLNSTWNQRQRPESEREKLSKTNVYLRGLPANMSDNDLVAMCVQYGRVTSAKALVDKTLSRGYGFVDFEQSSSADAAVKDLRSRGFFARMAKAVPRSEQGRGDDPTNLYLANLPPNYGERDLEQLLTSYGRITSVRVLRDENARSRGVGFARMDSVASCERAIASLNGSLWLVPDRPLLVKFADNKRSPDASKIVRARPTNSPPIVWWPNSAMYPHLAMPTAQEHVTVPPVAPLHIPPMQAALPPPMQHAAMQHAAMQQPPIPSAAMTQPPLGSHAVYYGYRLLTVSQAPPLSSPSIMPMAGSTITECWSPGEAEVVALVDG